MTKQPLTRINYNIPMGLYERERRGYPTEPGGGRREAGGGLRRPSDQAHRPPEAGGDEPAGRLVRGSAMQEVRCRGMKRAGARPAPQ